MVMGQFEGLGEKGNPRGLERNFGGAGWGLSTEGLTKRGGSLHI
jgi:hypothetical protein